MIESEAVIVKVEHNIAFVEAQRKSGCGHCDPQKGCATSTLTKFFGGKSNYFRVLNPINAVVGDTVVIGVADGAVLKSALAMYLMPLVFVLLGAGLGNFLAHSPYTQDSYAMLGAGVGLAVSYLWIKLYTARVGLNKLYQPVVLRKVAGDKVIQFAKGTPA